MTVRQPNAFERGRGGGSRHAWRLREEERLRAAGAFALMLVTDLVTLSSETGENHATQ